MAAELRPEDYRDGALVSIIVSLIMPATAVSERVHRTYMNGAALLMERLADGDWGLTMAPDVEVVREFLGRVIANAAGQGVIVTTEETVMDYVIE